jgi:succinate dehydrogenase/fumarate reductase cytochrome b subunit
MRQFLVIFVSTATLIAYITFFHLCYSINKVINEWSDYWNNKEAEQSTPIVINEAKTK